MFFIKQTFNNVPEAHTLNNPRQGTQSVESEQLPLSLSKACRRYATIDNKKLGDVIISIRPKTIESASLRDAKYDFD